MNALYNVASYRTLSNTAQHLNICLAASPYATEMFRAQTKLYFLIIKNTIGDGGSTAL